MTLWHKRPPIVPRLRTARYHRDIEPRLLLSDFIRHELSLTGKHVGCVCGSCTVLLEGVATQSCLCLAVQADGLSVETVESLGKVGALPDEDSELLIEIRVPIPTEVSTADSRHSVLSESIPPLKRAWEGCCAVKRPSGALSPPKL
jgi:hypothetical protein